MGGLNSHDASGAPQTENQGERGLPNDVQSRDDGTIARGHQGVWDVLSRSVALNLFRRRQGADLYDDGKTDTSGIDSTYSPWGSTDINTRGPDGRTPLSNAIRSEDKTHYIANIKHILDHPYVDINYPELQQTGLYSYNEVPPLTVAIRLNNKEAAELLLESGAFVNKLDSEHLSPLYYAAELGDLDIIDILLKYTTTLTSKPDVEDPLHAACRLGHKQVVRRLVEAGAEIKPEKVRAPCPLMLAAKGQHEEVCLYLIDKLCSRERDDLFIWACWFGCPRVVQYLVDSGIDVNVVSANNGTGLVHALRPGDLVRYGRQMRGVDKSSYLLKNVRNVLSESVSIISMLCCNLVDLEFSGVCNATPLTFALKSYNIPAAIALLKHGAIWDERCDNIFETTKLKQLHSIDPHTCNILLQFLDTKRRSLCKSRPCSATVPTLKDCCRHVIRTCVRCHRVKTTTIIPLLQYLPLPALLVDFLSFTELDETQLVAFFQIECLTW